ncbi:cubilin [Bicyclus anynana]|uniref:Cubilin n=1 Tax=Bicyclus anynana TaxID=110368 RepID=A0A6J1NQF1_BICAN|nr:cubilin [Bicyclus anynana]
MQRIEASCRAVTRGPCFTSRQSHTVGDTMSGSGALLVLTAAVCVCVIVQACEPNQTQHGCKIYGNACSCGYGCKTDFIYKSRRICLNALRERSANVCSRTPCLRGICSQTTQDPGFTCKCEGSGYYGQRCEKACPTAAVYGLEFPHECIVI